LVLAIFFLILLVFLRGSQALQGWPWFTLERRQFVLAIHLLLVFIVIIHVSEIGSEVRRHVYLMLGSPVEREMDKGKGDGKGVGEGEGDGGGEGERGRRMVIRGWNGNRREMEALVGWRGQKYL
jgi:hypothetical protein